MPIIFCGFSFGAATGLKATCGDQRVVGQISLGTPVSVGGREYAYEFLARCTTPKLFVSGGHDQYSPEAALRTAFANAAEPKKLVIVPDVDHFFVGRLPLMQAAIEEWITENFAGPARV